MSLKRTNDLSSAALLGPLRSDGFIKAASCLIVLAIFVLANTLRCESQSRLLDQDPALQDVLSRVIERAGGARVLASVQDVTESGEITFHWAEEVKGVVSIRLLGGNHFRMEADTADGSRTWKIKDGDGSVKEIDGSLHRLSYENALNFGNLTFPAAHVLSALHDSRAVVSLAAIENSDGRTVYRIRLKGQLGLHNLNAGPDVAITKDVLVDAATFDIISVEDQPFQTYELGGKPSSKPSRTVEFGDFHTVNRVRMPFLITTYLMGQKTLTIQLNNVTLNNYVSESDFK